MVFADSVNLARRLSSRNENDLLQENMMGKKKKLKMAFIYSQLLTKKID